MHNVFLGDDEDLVVVGDTLDKQVCYGMLNGAKVNAHLIPNPNPNKSFYGRTQWPAMKLVLSRHPGRDNIIRVIDPSDKDFGNVDVKTSQGLARLMDSRNPRIRVQARLAIRNKAPTEFPGQPCSAYFDMFINLYGPKSKAPTVGQWLGRNNLWLKMPVSPDPGFEICNPHVKVPPNPARSAAVSSAPREAYVYRTAEETRSEVMSMFDSLGNSEDLPEMEADERIITPLLKHQKQGLYFMIEKEKESVIRDQEEDRGSLWRLKYRPNGQRMYYNVITGREERNEPPAVLGGILGDMMGLGKTLSILALIVQGLQQASEWTVQAPPTLEEGEIPLERNVGTTLLVAPLSTLNNWEEQIWTHLRTKTLTYYVYHGHNRISDLSELAKYDMIITTYSIIGSEFRRRSRTRDISPLFKLNFFRIVLDEAHMIREQSTIQSQAVCKLSAQRRWAVTGTPVQNRLEDLGALIKFLRVKPFEKNGFAQFILSPFKNADPEILPKLRLLVDSITLRRLKDKLDLPPRNDLIVKLKFNEEEALLYDWFVKDSKQKAKAIAGDHRQTLGGRTYVHILRAILRLRLICAHGRELLSEEDLKMTEASTPVTLLI